MLIARTDLGEGLAGQRAAGGHRHGSLLRRGDGAVAVLAVGVIAPAEGGTSRGQRAGVVEAAVDLAVRAAPGHLHRCQAAGGRAVAELAGGVVAHAVRRLRAYGAREKAADADLGHRPFLRRCRSAGGRAVAELARGVLAPAVAGPPACQRAHRVLAGADLSEVQCTRHRHRRILLRAGQGHAVPQLAVDVVPPAVGGPRAGQRARVAVAGGDLGEGLAGQHPAGVHRHRCAAAGGRVVSQLAIGVIAPAIGLAALDHACVGVPGRDRGRG
jgi:hypothetical protein